MSGQRFFEKEDRYPLILKYFIKKGG